ncbi:LuxR C-terminal-related transcriptional regulator [Streptomyces cynarae]|uniref:LuxR C-terminal-related transcriptional regulator n=1 Tax=Streptomyces cynarae TaxID=2981134 RepID=UPI00406C670D
MTGDDATAVVGRVVELLQDLADVPIETLRSIAQESSVTHAVQLTEALLQLTPSGSSAGWLRCLLSELLFIAGRPADSVATVSALPQGAVAPSVAGSAAVAEVLSGALLHPRSAEASARRLLRAVAGDIDRDPAAIAAASVMADCRARAGDMEEALRWSRLVAHHADLVPSPFWSMHLLVEAAARLADAGEDAEAETLAERVRARWNRAPYPGIEAALARVQAKVLIQRGLWSVLNRQVNDVAAAATPERGERLHAPLLLAQLSIAAVYAGDLPTAQTRLEACRRLLPEQGAAVWEARHAPEVSWAELLWEECDGGPKRAVQRLTRLARDPRAPLVRLFATVPGAAAWAARIAVDAGQRGLARHIGAVTEDVRARQPVRAALSADHVRGVLDRDPVALTRAATQHRHAWARARAASDLAASLEDRAGPPPAWQSEPGRHRGSWHVVPAEQPERDDGGQESGWEALSGREQQVARLAAAGLTNRQIASRVHCSVHTVNFHLRSVFRKLKITSRVEIGRHLASEARAHPTG